MFLCTLRKDEMRKPDTNLHLERHKQMLAYQRRIWPFTATISELRELWILRSTSNVVYELETLTDLGLCVMRQHGAKRNFYAVETEQPALARHGLSGAGAVPAGKTALRNNTSLQVDLEV